MMPALSLVSVKTRLGTRDFHYDFSLEGPGIVAVNGPSGAGKSTLLHLIAGFEVPQSGQVIMNGEEVTQTKPGKRPTSLVFQDHNLFAHLDVFTNVALGISPSLTLGRTDKFRISEALDAVGLSGFEERMPQQLSGGEKQRAAFARVLVRNRPFLLLDEAFSSLDEALRESMGELLKRLQQENGLMVLMISHDRREIRRLADRVIEIRDGRNIFEGTRAEWEGFANGPDETVGSLKID